MSSISLTLGLRGRLLSGTQVTLQGTLFGNNEPGFTFEPWDITTLYQDRAGTTPVTAAGQSVGLRLDKSKQTYFEPRRNLLTYTEQFNNAAWTKENITVTENTAIAPNGTTTATKIIETTATAEHKVFQPQTVLANTNYTITCYMKAGERTKAYIRDGWATGFNALFDLSNGTIISSLGGTASITSVGNGWYRCQFVMSTTATTLRPDFGPANAANSRNYTGDGISGIYIWGAQFELGSTATAYQATAALPVSWLGNHEVAVSDAKRGVYGWMPKTGRRNLLERTEEFGDAYWNTTAVTVVPDQTAAHTGTITADRITKASVAFQSAFRTSITSVASQTYTVSAYFKSDTLTRASIAAISGTTDVRYWFDLSAKTVGGAIGSFTTGYVDSAIEDVGGGWLRFSLTVTAQATQIATYFYPDKADNAVAGSVFVWGAQLEPGSTATAYQRVVSQYDITEAGVPTCYYVQADGVDDAYVTPTITPGTDKVQVFAGVRKLSDAAIGAVMESSANSNSNAGAIWLLSPGSPGVNQYSFRSKGTTAADANASGFSAPITNILTGLGDIAADSAILRVNGAQVAQSTADQGTGNYLAYPAYIYSRGGTSLPFNGLDFGHAVRFGPNLDAATIARVESLIARNTPEVTL